MLTITYIFHDCFVLEIKNKCVLIFDYWKDPLCEEKSSIPDFIRSLDKSLPCYIFVSHHHKDHLNRCIFDWAEKYENIFFILSTDTAKFVRHVLRRDSVWNGYKVPASRYCVLKKGEQFSDDSIEVHAFGSTDIGNSYVVECNGVTIFHAGDLNAWIWKDESTPQEVETALTEFRGILDSIKLKFPFVDIAMFPVDSRIGTDYWTGASEWLKTIKTGLFLPMHFTLASTPQEEVERKNDAFQFSRYVPSDSKTICAALCKRGDRLLIPCEILITSHRGSLLEC